MKKNLLFVFVFVCMDRGQAQPSTNRSQFHSIAADLGADYTLTNADLVNHWAIASGQKSPGCSVSGHFTISYLSQHFAGGIEVVFPDPYRLAGGFVGVRLTHFRSRVASWLNFHIGYFDALYNSLHPVNYTPTPDQAGKKLQLQYNNGYVGIASKTYWKHHHKKGGSTMLGLDLMAGCTPWAGHWSYGYYVGSGKSVSFVSEPVSGIPSISNLFLNMGIFCGLDSR
jgi:hypothetical protein